MSKNNGNSIRPREHGSQVILDPNFLLRHALYMPDGEHIVKSSMTLGQAIEAIALAHVKARMPQLAGKCKVALTAFAQGMDQEDSKGEPGTHSANFLTLLCIVFSEIPRIFAARVLFPDVWSSVVRIISRSAWSIDMPTGTTPRANGTS